MRRGILLLAMLLLASSYARAQQRYAVSGLVVSVDRPRQTIVVSCQNIPGYMDAMAMPFRVREAKQLENLEPGAMVEFTLVVDKDSSLAENVRIRAYQSVDQEPMQVRQLKVLEALAAPGSEETRELQVGQPVPEFALIDQNHRRITLAQFLGRVVAITFIYTSCPLPDYCFRLSNNFGLLQKRFTARMERDLVLLSISFDPEHDQPEVLAEYARTWKASANGWYFLTGSTLEVRKMCRVFGMTFWPDEGLIMHSLHTVVLDRRGRLVANIEGNQFTATQLGDLVEAVINRQN